MTLTVQDIELSGFVLPYDDDQLIRRDIHEDIADPESYYKRYDQKTLFYDCFLDQTGTQVVLLGPRLFNLKRLLEDTDFRLDGIPIKPLAVEKLSRCSVVLLPTAGAKPAVLTLSHDRFGGNIPVGASFVEAYRDTNALFALSKNNELSWIQDWLYYNHKIHGANAVVFADNVSTKYSRDELVRAISAVEGIEQATVVRARYRFGPTEEKFDNALFLQRSLAELFRRRFLGAARAVINTDVDELFHSKSGRSIFDATAESESGYVRADARWVYVNDTKGEFLPRHRHHGFVTKSGKPKSNRKYAVAPAGSQAGRQWLTHFIQSRRDPVDPDFELWHFRNLNTGWKEDRSISSGALEEYSPLQDAMSAVFGGRGGRPPLVPLSRHHNADRQKLIVTAMKNESSFILEWIAYHRAIGFNNFLVYTNDCSDHTVQLLEALQARGYLSHEENRVLRRGPQKSALKYAREHLDAEQADWVLVSDIDEFLNIHIGNGTVDELIDSLPGADAIPVTWKIFGCGDVIEYADQLVTNTFFDSERSIGDGGMENRFAKTLFRPTNDIERFGTHGPIVVEGADFVWMSPDGRILGEDDNLTRPVSSFSYEVAQINHYAVGSVDAFLVKRDRGRVNHYRQTMDMDYWAKMNRSGAKDSSILRHRDRMLAEMDALLADPEIKALHDKGVEWRRKKIEELKGNLVFAEMRASILAKLGTGD
ncbi:MULTISPECIES: glycosyltransferase family 2 protein [unclassified Ruegeria]|uniref:glycosyltransferase family 2 protein n=1 Tax=unclassified Ruegeria TaxID=2625375 RepID=UPI001488C0CA|nr:MULTISPECIES: glycosyltransferase family 2 protein [unclassified Ruegeria]